MISKEQFLEMLRDGDSHRKQFSEHSGVQKNKSSPTFSVPFDCGLGMHFTAKTGHCLKWNPKFSQFYCFLRNTDDINAVEAWETEQGTRVFIRSLLDSAVALDVNFVDNTSGEKTHFGSLEENAKYREDTGAINQCASAMTELVEDIDHLRNADCICAIPANPRKKFDFPRELAGLLAEKLRMPDTTGNIDLSGKRKSAKDCSVDEKWETWAAAELELNGINLTGKKIILVDDKYQSGVTMHVVASWLKSQGVSEVHGVVVVKTLRDTDNLDVVET